MKLTVFQILSLFFLLAVGTAVWTFADGSMQPAPGIDAAMVEKLLEIKTARKFTDELVPCGDIETILRAGVNAPSGHNRQPWHFTAITNKALLDEIDTAAGKPKERLSLAGSPLAIVISADESSSLAVFDCGTASDRMAAAAIALGYGVKSIATPVNVISEKYMDRLGISDKFRPVAILLVGREVPDADAISAATTRDPFDEKVDLID